MDRRLQHGPFNMRSISLFVLLFAPLAFAEGPVAPVTSEDHLVKSVRVLGTKSAVDLKTQVGQMFDADTIHNDVRHLWATGRFEDIRVETAPQEEGTSVTFHVVEMPQLALHTMHVEPSTYGLQMSLPEGTPMSRLRAHQIANQAQESLRADGFRTATVDYDLVPYIGNKVDLRLNIDAGERIRVKEVDFEGDTEFDSKELRGALRSLKIHRVTPRIPGIWNGYIQYPGYSPEGVQGDMALLRSYYISRGYFEAAVKLDKVQVEQKEAHVSIQVQAGPLYHVRSWQIYGNGVIPQVEHPLNGLMRHQNFCSGLFVARRQAEHEGILDFSVNMQVQPTPASTKEAPEADLTANVERGAPFHVGRIEFIGNKSFSEAAVRSNFLLEEGDLLDEHVLRKSMARLNEAGFFEPISERNAIVHTDPKTGIADIDFRVVERKRGSWNLSGPVGPPSVAGSLEASIQSRLPMWGSGVFELSTYKASISMFAFNHPLASIFGTSSSRTFFPLGAFQRPYTPGAGWLSGFTIVPQLSWQYMLLAYGVSQLQHRLTPILEGDRHLEPELAVGVEGPTSQTTMFCEPPALRYSLLRNGLVMGLRFAGSVAGL